MKKNIPVARYGILIALALILSFVEAQIPPLVAVPGMKLGLTNIVVLAALYLIDNKSALIINIIRIILVGILFTSLISMLFSIVGGIFSFVTMLILKRTEKFNIITVSVAGAVSHNVGQILTAMIVLNSMALGSYFLILWFTGLLSGIVIGISSGEVIKRLKTHVK